MIWEATLDKKYYCKVERKKEYQGTLYIFVNGEIIFSKEVPLAFDAMFGPDIDDVIDWEATILEYIDEVFCRDR